MWVYRDKLVVVHTDTEHRWMVKEVVKVDDAGGVEAMLKPAKVRMKRCEN